MRYDRKIKYLELWERENRIRSVGFVKLEVRDKGVKILIKADKLNDINDGERNVLLLGKGKEFILGKLLLHQGRMEAEFEDREYEGIVGDIGYEDLQEVVVRLTEHKELRCSVREKVVEQEGRMPLEIQEVMPVSINAFEKREEVVSIEKTKEEEVILSGTQSEEEKVVLQEEIFVKKTDIGNQELREKEGELEETEVSQDAVTEMVTEEKRMEPPAATKWQQIWNRYSHIKPFEDSREYIKLRLEDLEILTKDSYTVIFNSFLLHGFYNYEHLILTKTIVQGKERYYLGTPGNFFEKEKQVAVLFGFESFEGKEEPAKKGDFGYYMISVDI